MNRYTSAFTAKIAIAAIAIAILIVAAAPAPVAQQPGPTAVAVTAAGVSTAQQAIGLLRAQIATAGRVPVIIGLRVPAFERRNSLGATEQEVLTTEIAATQARVVSRIGALSTGSHSFASIPAVAMSIDDAMLTALLADPEVEGVYLDHIFEPTLTESTRIVQADQATAAGADGRNQTIAVLDTGTDLRNPVFSRTTIVREACFSQTFCPGGTTSSTAPGSAAPCPSALPGCFHGTFVSSIAVGVAPAVNLIPVQVFSQYSNGLGASTSDILKGLEFVFGLRNTYSIAAVNLSLGTATGFSGPCDNLDPPLAQMVTNLKIAGIGTIAAAGNGSFSDRISSPACLSAATPVGNTNKTTDSVNPTSNANSMLQLLAPGTDIRAAGLNGGSVVATGTSASAPAVSAATAAVRSRLPNASIADIVQSLKNTGVMVRDTRNGLSFPRIRIMDALTAMSASDLEITVTQSASSTAVGVPVEFTCTVKTRRAFDHVGCSFSFPTLDATNTATQGYSSAKGSVVSVTAPSGARILFLAKGANLNCLGGSCTAKHLLAEFDAGAPAAAGERSWTVKVTPTLSGDLPILVRAWATSPAYTNAIRVPASGNVTDQQGWPAERRALTVFNPCTSFSASPTSVEAKAEADSVTVSVTGKPAGCTGNWAGSANNSWIRLSKATGTQNDTVEVYFDANPSSSGRKGSINIGDATVVVTQAAKTVPPCEFSVEPNQLEIDSAAGSRVISVTGSPAGCAGSWTASAKDFTSVNRTQGSGSGTVEVSWTANPTSSARSTTLLIAGKTVTVSQQGKPSSVCSYGTDATLISATAAAGSKIVRVTGSPEGCVGGWQASGGGFVDVNPKNGTTSANVSISWSANSGTARTSSARVGDSMIEVKQEAMTGNPNVEVIATGLEAPARLLAMDKQIFIVDNKGESARIMKTALSGGALSTAVSVPAIVDNGLAGISTLARVDANRIAFQIGTYAVARIEVASFDTNQIVTLTRETGGGMAGVVGSDVIFGAGFGTIKKVPTAGGGSTVIVTGPWMRSAVVDDKSVFFWAYGDKAIYRLDVSTQSLTRLVDETEGEGELLANTTMVVYNHLGKVKVVPKAGGLAKTVLTADERAVAADDDYVYYTKNGALLALRLDDGHVLPLAQGLDIPYALVHDGFIYAADRSLGVGAGRLLRVPVPARTATTTTIGLSSPDCSVSMPCEVAVAIDTTNPAVNAYGATIQWDPSKLDFRSARSAASMASGTLTLNADKAAEGLLGVLQTLQPGQALGTGPHDLLNITFAIRPGVDTTTTVSLTSALVEREVVGSDATTIPADWRDGVVSVEVGMESDVSPRPSGSGTLTAADQTLICNIAAALDSVSAGEFQRVDSAPMLTRGDGRVSVSDCGQARLDVARLTPSRPAGGPAGPVAAGAVDTTAARTAALRIRATSVVRQTPSPVSVELRSSVNVSGVSFTLRSPSGHLGIGEIRVPAGMSAEIVLNRRTSSEVGVMIVRPPGISWPKGQHDILTVDIIPSSGAAGSERIEMDDRVIVREVSDEQANPVGATFSGATMTVVQTRTLVARPTRLRFGAARDARGSAISTVTPVQTISVAPAGFGDVEWIVTSDRAWLVLDMNSGRGSAAVQVHVDKNKAPVTETSTATVTVALRDGSESVSIPVTLSVLPGSVGIRPFGHLDTPMNGATDINGAIGVTGWVVDDVGVSAVRVYRRCVDTDLAAACHDVLGHWVVFLGEATMVDGARPDVDQEYRNLYPGTARAGYGFALLTNMLPDTTNGRSHGGNGPSTLLVVARDLEGQESIIGAGQQSPITINLGNSRATKPFGTIDTPPQGAVVSGAIPVFLWALTPDRNTGAYIPKDGSTLTLYIDGIPMGKPSYSQCRGSVGNPVAPDVFCDDDIANVFGATTPQAPLTPRTSNPTAYRNLDAGQGAIASYVLDTTTLADGAHTIAVSVTDSLGRVEGIGSRIFVVQNGSTPSPNQAAQSRNTTTSGSPSADTTVEPAERIAVRSGFDGHTKLHHIDVSQDATVDLRQFDRLELRLKGLTAAYMVDGDQMRTPAPTGSTVDSLTGTFTWQPGPAFIGPYRIVLDGAAGAVIVTIVVKP